MDYTKIIFVSKENVLLGPMAEWIMKSILMDNRSRLCHVVWLCFLRNRETSG